MMGKNAIKYNNFLISLKLWNNNLKIWHDLIIRMQSITNSTIEPKWNNDNQIQIKFYNRTNIKNRFMKLF